MSETLFVADEGQWERFAAGVVFEDGEAGAPCYENACLLPPVEVKGEAFTGKVFDGEYRGGIRVQSGSFIDAHLRADDAAGHRNLSCSGDYEVAEGSMAHREGRVMFGGVLYRHFGHMLIDGFSRLWYAVGHDDFDRIVFFECPFEFPSDYDPFEFLALLGLSEDDVEIIREPTVFSEVIVPDEAFRPFGSVRREFVRPFDAIKAAVPAGGVEKVYLSRRAYQSGERSNDRAKGIVFNERWYEEFYSRRGFAVVHPEQLPLAEQVAVISGARQIVSTVGTMTHLLLFADPDAEVTLLNRVGPIRPQLRVDAVRGISPTYVDAASNPLPVVHACGPFLMVPNRHFKSYLDHAGIEYDGSELDISDEMPRLVYGFLEEWTRIYSAPEYAGLIGKRSMLDVVRMMNEALNDDPGDTEAYGGAGRLRADNIRLREENKRLRREAKRLAKRLAHAEERAGVSKPKPGKFLRAIKRKLS